MSRCWIYTGREREKVDDLLKVPIACWCKMNLNRIRRIHTNMIEYKRIEFIFDTSTCVQRISTAGRGWQGGLGQVWAIIADLLGCQWFLHVCGSAGAPAWLETLRYGCCGQAKDDDIETGHEREAPGAAPWRSGKWEICRKGMDTLFFYIFFFKQRNIEYRILTLEWFHVTSCQCLLLTVTFTLTRSQAICQFRDPRRIFRNMSLATTIFWILAGVWSTVYVAYQHVPKRPKRSWLKCSLDH